MVAGGFLWEVLVKNERHKQFGVMLMGLGLIFFGMELMSNATTPLRSYQPFIELMQRLRNPFLGMLFAAFFTALVQSSSATTSIIIVLAGQGFITLEAGVALILGANIGTCVTAMLSAIGKPIEAVRAAIGHALFNVLGVLIWVGLIPIFADVVRAVSPAFDELSGVARAAAETPRQIANAHTFFNVANALIFIWLTKPIERLVFRMVPHKRVKVSSRQDVKFLDDYYLEHTDQALDRSRRELMRMGALIGQTLRKTLQLVLKGDQSELQTLRSMDEAVDQAHAAVLRFLGKLSVKPIVDSQATKITDQIAVAN